MFAQQNYDNPTLEKEVEFYDDIKRFKYLKRLFRKYDITGEIKIRLIFKALIVLQNVFGGEVAITLLLYKIDRKVLVGIKDMFELSGVSISHELDKVKTDKNIEEMLKEL